MLSSLANELFGHAALLLPLLPKLRPLRLPPAAPAAPAAVLQRSEPASNPNLSTGGGAWPRLASPHLSADRLAMAVARSTAPLG